MKCSCRGCGGRCGNPSCNGCSINLVDPPLANCDGNYHEAITQIEADGGVTCGICLEFVANEELAIHPCFKEPR